MRRVSAGRLGKSWHPMCCSLLLFTLIVFFGYASCGSLFQFHHYSFPSLRVGLRNYRTSRDPEVYQGHEELPNLYGCGYRSPNHDRTALVFFLNRKMRGSSSSGCLLHAQCGQFGGGHHLIWFFQRRALNM